jgi:hypothetical protein
MVARSGIVFPASMVDILANPVEICFGSFNCPGGNDLSGDRCEDPDDTRRRPRFRSGVEDPPA